MQQVTYTCDVCQKQKQETNHWFLLLADSKWVSFCHWDSEQANIGHIIHLCGQECATKKLSEFLSAPQAGKGNAA